MEAEAPLVQSCPVEAGAAAGRSRGEAEGEGGLLLGVGVEEEGAALRLEGEGEVGEEGQLQEVVAEEEVQGRLGEEAEAEGRAPLEEEEEEEELLQSAALPTAFLSHLGRPS